MPSSLIKPKSVVRLVQFKIMKIYQGTPANAYDKYRILEWHFVN